MKKAKILLTAITIFAVVGGIFAFKANTMNEQFICTASESGACETFTRLYTLTSTGNPVTTLYTTTTTTVNFEMACPTNGCTVLTPLYTEQVN